jgi:hypothetical protein
MRIVETRLTTVQCVLPINIINEKIYVFLWFWFIILSALTLLGNNHCSILFGLIKASLLLISHSLGLTES